MARKVINESTLKRIISEALKKALNEIYEIGDTEQGYNAIRQAQDKARQEGRPIQGQRFEDYADNIDQSKYGLVPQGTINGIKAVNQKNIVYQPQNGMDEYIAISNKGVISTKAPGSDNWVASGNINNVIPAYAKLSNDRKAEARKIAAWCAKFFQADGDGAKAIASNWHNWVKL